VNAQVLLASDLDRTLIYSRSALGGCIDDADLVSVEKRNGVDVSFVTTAAATLIAELHRTSLLVPVTTRVTDQLRRVRLPGTASRFAVAANGAVLLTDGEPDREWQRRIALALTAQAPWREVWVHANSTCRAEWTQSIRDADGIFCYAVVDRSRLPGAFVAEQWAWAARRGWAVSLQGRKLYWMPIALSKAAAVAEIAARVGADTVLAAGDSVLDLDLLAQADAGIHPRHGELAASGWSAPHVEQTRASGAGAGEEICQWFLRRVGPARDEVSAVALGTSGDGAGV
jgi:hypothetical protein